jgi:hypothetical protein
MGRRGPAPTPTGMKLRQGETRPSRVNRMEPLRGAFIVNDRSMVDMLREWYGGALWDADVAAREIWSLDDYDAAEAEAVSKVAG